MESDQRTPGRSPNRTRENIVILTLTLFVGGILLFFLDLISFGIFTYAIAVGLGVILLGCFHYLAWGRSMNEAVAAEREALRLQEAREQPDQHLDGIQDLARRRGIQRGRPPR